MQYYSRTQPATRGAAPAVPGTAFTPDGKLHLAVPVRRAAAAGSSSGDAQQGGPDGNDGGIANSLVLMMPPKHGDGLPRDAWFHSLLAADAAVIIIGLTESASLSHYTDTVLTPGIFGLLTVAIGKIAGGLRSPGGLGLFALLAMVQLLAGLLLLTTLPQLFHLILLPFLAQRALTLRRMAMPLWFSTHGRTAR